MNTINTEQKAHLISLRTYNQIKAIVKLLRKEVNFTKFTRNLSNYEDFDFSDLNDPSIDGADLAQSIYNNPVIQTATNLRVIFTNDDIVICPHKDIYGCDNYATDDASITIMSVLHSMEKLVSLGRHGIYMRIIKNRKIQKKVYQLETKMTLL